MLRRGPEDLICSARDCENAADFAISWSNPNIHFGRKKHWLACADHRGSLEKYLGYRDFPQETQPIDVFLAQQGPGTSKSTGVDH